MKTYEQLGAYIIEKRHELASKLDGGSPDLLLSKNDEQKLLDLQSDLISYIGTAIKEDDPSMIDEQVIEWARKAGESAVQRGIELDEGLSMLSQLRVLIWNIMLEKQNEFNFSAEEVTGINFNIEPIINKAAREFSLTYVEDYRRYLKKAQSSVMEYSVPVVGLNDDVAILPLIGELDDDRARVLKEVALHKCLELRNSTLILDLSGVPTVDTMVANELSQVIDSLKLIGVKTILTGLRPEIAQAVVEIGIKFEGMTIRKNLKMAIEGLKI
ncbi:STAS domain-containing protein [Jeotgalibacillus salarius]|uniref:STAS domain-containing protein n=1 Tax=Jeotgalibacillus salarius TaxID=546023 RepID=A0A4Y8LH32_9BACL|nr:STAS domain-containing protein [Jeotgalibacillus salarius]TFE02102.1 STAS domain-containing protein [Jeotgalibacillus salarius]